MTAAEQEALSTAVVARPLQMTTMSLTNDIKDYLGRARSTLTSAELTVNPLDGIYEAAAKVNMTTFDYIQTNPQQAVMTAEACVNQWSRIIAEAALTGVIHTESGVVRVNKSVTDLLKERLRAAEAALEQVTQFALSAVADGTQRKDQLIQALYNQAIVKGNTKAMTYLIDRIEGRTGESKQLALDYDNAYNVYNIVHSLFDKQLEVLNSGPGTKIICCSRRAGKTHTAAALCLIECLRQPNVTCLYIGKTMELAEGLLYEAMNQIIDVARVKDSKGQRLNFKRFENGSKILVRGLSNTKDPDMIRGHKAKVIIIDEFFHMIEDGLLEYMISEVLEPMQMDFATDHKMMFIGTPPRVKGTYGEKMWKESTSPHFRWTFRENPFPAGQDKEAFVMKKLSEKGLDWSSPYAQREYGGDFVYDEDSLLYPVYHTYDPQAYTPQMNITNVYFGIDYGMSDYTALIGVAWDAELRRGFIFFEVKFNRLQVEKDVSMLEQLKREIRYAWDMALDFFPSYSKEEANKRVWWDADSNNQGFTDDLRLSIRLRDAPSGSKIKLQISDAHKVDKVLMHDKIRDVLRVGALLVPKDSKTCQEIDKTILKRNERGDILPEIDENYYHPDLLDALRYAMWNAIGIEVADEKRGLDFMEISDKLIASQVEMPHQEGVSMVNNTGSVDLKPYSLGGHDAVDETGEVIDDAAP